MKKFKFILELIILILLILIGIITYLSASNPDFQNFVDDIQDKLMNNYCTSISKASLKNANSSLFVPYSNGVLRVNAEGFQYYTGQKTDWELEFDYKSPTVNTAGKYIVVGESGSTKLALYDKNDLIWLKEVDGEIQNVTANINGFVGVIYKNKTFRQVVKIFNLSGEEVLVRYYTSNYAIALRISDDGKYFAIGELDLSSNVTTSFSGIRIISSDKEDISYFEKDAIIIDVKFISDKEIVALYDKKVVKYNIDGTTNVIKDLEKSETLDLLLGNSGTTINIKKLANIAINETEFGNIEFINSENIVTGVYNYIDKATNSTTLNNVLAINYDLGVTFINFSGRRIGQFKTDSSIKNVILFNNGYSAVIVYSNSIEFIKVH